MNIQTAVIIFPLMLVLAVVGCTPAQHRAAPPEAQVGGNTGPVVTIQHMYYDVQGTSVMEIRRDLYAQSPIVADGETRDARTDWIVAWDIGRTETETGCRVDRITTTAEITYLLPRLRNRESVSAELLAEWDAYMEALLTHESRHQQFAVEAADKIESLPAGFGEHDTCEAAVQEARRIAGNVIQSAQRRERQYDYTTQHGYAQGAEFPSSLPE